MPGKKMTESEIVMAAGLTQEEAECWEIAVSLAVKFFRLPKLHKMHDHEFAHAMHVIQNKLLARPAYRKYLELTRGKTGPIK